MNNLIELFGNHIYKTAPTNPLSARKKLCFAFSTAGLMCKYFPTKNAFAVTPIYAVGGCRFCNHTAENGQKFCNRKSVSASAKFCIPWASARCSRRLLPAIWLPQGRSRCSSTRRSKILFRKRCALITRLSSEWWKQEFCQNLILSLIQPLPVTQITCRSGELRNTTMCLNI